ncbi:hypothetical protein COCMIDRAFT_105476 [Bipolaris oryzae ATCC 44560]|uniref:Uncharacterized protein n=1 Tax=Bipolaris oryzae ATCC 44560 TaxID=930090 RepID=W6YQJ7_COCMI|nr:uncharacterized protein COCMIDRAFT_105476 [Bipolaris oryzae ATCC 44560]EUC41692.1 hypothetical protein COCMIDRAFT_105476 [Bipolaris oryzae ATCC 44560]
MLGSERVGVTTKIAEVQQCPLSFPINVSTYLSDISLSQLRIHRAKSSQTPTRPP